MQPQIKRRNFNTMEDRRLQAIRLLHQGLSQAEIARQLKVSRQAVHIWYQKYQTGKRTALRSTTATGRPPKIAFSAIKQRLPKILIGGAAARGFVIGLWTTANIAAVIKQEFGVSYHRDHVRRLLHTLGFSWQKPRRQAAERDERVIQKWLRQEWPRIKKSRPG